MAASTHGPVVRTEPTLVISLDLELAWGSLDHGYGPELLAMARWTHDVGARTLLDQLTRSGLSATWAVVGVVMLDRLPALSDLQPLATRDGRDWFSFVPPGATEQSAPEWFGASLVEELAQARPRQEIGFHGFTHVVLGDPRLPPERAHQELAACAALALLIYAAPKAWRALRVLVRVRRVRQGQASVADATLLYARMLELMRRRGFQKPAWFTPQEFAASLPRTEMGLLVDQFTEAYNALRFGGRVAVAPRMSMLLERLEQERSTGR